MMGMLGHVHGFVHMGWCSVAAVKVTAGVTTPCSFDGTAQGAGRRHPVCSKCGLLFIGWLRTMLRMLQ
jgi:hypothetical protein